MARAHELNSKGLRKSFIPQALPLVSDRELRPWMACRKALLQRCCRIQPSACLCISALPPFCPQIPPRIPGVSLSGLSDCGIGSNSFVASRGSVPFKKLVNLNEFFP